MDTPGNVLRLERESQKKSLKDVAKKIKIKTDYLRAIEDDNYALLPAEVFTKAYLRLYADTLGLDSEFVLSLFQGQPEDEAVTHEEQTEKEKPPLDFRNVLRKLPVKPVLITAALSLLVVTAMLLVNTEKQKPALNYENKAEASAPAEDNKQNELHLTITATELTWVMVSTDGGNPDERLLRVGESVTFSAMKGFALTIGNAGGTKLVLNNQDIGTLGPRGKVVDIVLP